MRKIILVLLVCWVHGVVVGQEVIQFKKNEILKPINEVITNTNYLNTFLSVRSSKKLQQNISSENYYKKIGEIDGFVLLKNTTTNDTIVMNSFELNEKSNPVTPRWNFGMVTLPMKIRFGGGSEDKNTRRYFDLEAGFNLGLALSYKLSNDYRSETQTHWLLTIGTSQVKLTPESTNGKINNDLSVTAFSPTTGFVFHFNNKLQFITIIGWDFIPGKIGTEWLYKDKPFFGLGIGFKAFEIGKKPEERQNN
jgi:hypothetical protein